jgi:hypothetical protein
VENTHQRVGGVRTIVTVREMSLFAQKWPSAKSLEAPSYDLPLGVECVGGGPAIYRRRSFLLSSAYFSFSSG